MSNHNNNSAKPEGGSRSAQQQQRTFGAHRSDRSKVPNEDIVSVTAGDHPVRSSLKKSAGQDSVKSGAAVLSEPNANNENAAGRATDTQELISVKNDKIVEQREMAFTHTLLKGSGQSPDLLAGQVNDSMSAMRKTDNAASPFMKLNMSNDAASNGTRATQLLNIEAGTPTRRAVDIKPSTEEQTDVVLEEAVSPVRQMYPTDEKSAMEIKMFSNELAATPQGHADQGTGVTQKEQIAQHQNSIGSTEADKALAQVAGRYGVGGTSMMVHDSVLQSAVSKKQRNQQSAEQLPETKKLFSKLQSGGMSSMNRTSPDLDAQAGRTTRAEYNQNQVAVRNMQFQIPQKKEAVLRDIYKSIDSQQRLSKSKVASGAESRNRLTAAQNFSHQPADIQIKSYAKDAMMAQHKTYSSIPSAARGDVQTLYRTGSLEVGKPLHLRRDFKQGLNQGYVAEGPASVRGADGKYVSLPLLGRPSQDANENTALPAIAGSSLRTAGKTLLTTSSMERMALRPAADGSGNAAQAFMAASGATPSSTAARSLRRRGGSLSPLQDHSDQKDKELNTHQLLQLAGKTFQSQRVIPPEMQALTQRLRNSEQQFMRIAQNSPELIRDDKLWHGNQTLSIKIDSRVPVKPLDLKPVDYFTQDTANEQDDSEVPDAKVSVNKADFSIKISGGGLKETKYVAPQVDSATPSVQASSRRTDQQYWSTTKLRFKESTRNNGLQQDRSARNNDEYELKKALEPIRAREQADLERERRANAAAARRMQQSDGKDSSLASQKRESSWRRAGQGQEQQKSTLPTEASRSLDAGPNVKIIQSNKTQPKAGEAAKLTNRQKMPTDAAIGAATQQPSLHLNLKEPKVQARPGRADSIHNRVDSLFEMAERARANAAGGGRREEPRRDDSGLDTAMSDEHAGALRSNYYKGTNQHTEVGVSLTGGAEPRVDDGFTMHTGLAEGELLSFADSATEETSQFKYTTIVSRQKVIPLQRRRAGKHLSQAIEQRMTQGSSAPSYAGQSLTRIQNKKNNPHDRSFNQEKLLDTIKRQQDQLKTQRLTIERLEKDASRFRLEASAQKKRVEHSARKIDNNDFVQEEVNKKLGELAQRTDLASVLFNVDGRIEEPSPERADQQRPAVTNGRLNPARRSQILSTLKSAGIATDCLQIVLKYLGEIEQFIIMAQKQAIARDATIKRYRNMINQQLSDTKKMSSPDGRRPSYIDTSVVSFTAAAPFPVEMSSLKDDDCASRSRVDGLQARLSLSPVPIVRESLAERSADNQKQASRGFIQIYSSTDFDAKLSKSVSKEVRTTAALDASMEQKSLGRIAEGNECGSELYSDDGDAERPSREARNRSKTQMNQQSQSVSPAKAVVKASVEGAQQNGPQAMGIVTRSTSIKLPSHTASLRQTQSLKTRPAGVGGSAGFNHARMHKLMSIVLAIRKAKTFPQIVPACLADLDKVMSCKGAMLVLLDPNLCNSEDMRTFTRAGFQTHSQTIDGKHLYMVTTQELQGAEAAFTRYADAKYPVARSNCLSQPILDHKGRVIATLQVQTTNNNLNSKRSPAKANNSPAKRISLRDREQSTDYNSTAGAAGKGMPMIDQHTLCLLATVIGLKLDETLAVSKSHAMRREVVDTIKLAGSICTQRSQPELVRLVKKHLPRYFGFQAVGIMFRDQKSNSLFTVNEIAPDDAESSRDDLLMSTLTGVQQRETPEQARAARRPRGETQTQTITVPSSMGVTGYVVREKRVFLSNNVLADKYYQGNVDNQTDVKDVNSIMVGPVFGHKSNPFKKDHPEEKQLGAEPKKKVEYSDLHKPETAYKDIDTDMPIGVVQLVNKLNGKQIDEYDQQKFEAIQTLIGLSIDNTQEYNSVLNIRIGMYKHLKELKHHLARFFTKSRPRDMHEAANEASISAISEHALQDKDKVERQIKEMIQKLDKLRDAAKLDELMFLVGATTADAQKE